MENLFPATKVYAAICGTQKIKDLPYRLTRHCISVPCPDGELLYHTLTGELVLIPNGESRDDNRAELIRRRFLVPEDFDDYAYASQARQIAELMENKKRQLDSFLIFTTTDCNARCYYCYELGRPRLAMSDGTARDVAAFLLEKSAPGEIALCWFGGEPLYNRPAIDRITSILREHGKPFRSRMVSNGYLFDAETVRTAVEDWHLQKIQIPLDGTEQVYNRAKAFIYREGSAYQRVLENIGLLQNAGIKVSIRLNLGVDNFDDLMALSRELAARFPDCENLGVYVALLHDFGASPQNAVSDDQLFARYDALCASLKEGGLLRAAPLSDKLSLNACMADADSSVAILPDGSLGKCEHESEQALIGSIYSPELDRARIAAWKERISIPECRVCDLYPRCICLKNCAWNADGCRPRERELRRRRLISQIYKTYEQKYNRTPGPAREDDTDELC